jgi:hypothetical protein
MTDSAGYPFTTTVHRPGLPDVHLGFWFEHQAEEAAASLTWDLISTQHVEGTTVTFSPTPNGVEPLPPVPDDVTSIAVLMDEEDDDLPMGHAFPDLFSRLKAQVGYEAASATWTAACRWLDDERSEE